MNKHTRSNRRSTSHNFSIFSFFRKILSTTKKFLRGGYKEDFGELITRTYIIKLLLFLLDVRKSMRPDEINPKILRYLSNKSFIKAMYKLRNVLNMK